MMLIQSRFVLDVLLGRDSGWNAQNRAGTDAPFGEIAKRHIGHMLAGIAAGTLALFISTYTFLWLLPIVAGLVLSPVISWATGVRAYGIAAWTLEHLPHPGGRRSGVGGRRPRRDPREPAAQGGGVGATVPSSPMRAECHDRYRIPLPGRDRDDGAGFIRKAWPRPPRRSRD